MLIVVSGYCESIKGVNDWIDRSFKQQTNQPMIKESLSFKLRYAQYHVSRLHCAVDTGSNS